MRITVDTEKGIFIVPNTFEKNLEKQNKILRQAGAKEITTKEFIQKAVEDAFTRPILTQAQAKDWNADLENQMAK